MMMPRRKGENSDDNQFSFSGPMATRGSDEFETWAERIKSDYGYFGRSGKMKQVGAWAKRNHVNPDEGEFTWMAKEDDEDVPSPPLWEKEGGSPASKSDEAYPILGHTMRSQMMARYRKEMIDLVRDAPENAYELSLRDIVDIPRPVKSTELEEKKGEKEMEIEKKKETKKGGRRMARSESLDTGLLLKMFVPATMGRKKSFGVNGTCSKVSPKPVIADAERSGGPEKGPDNEWWKKKEINESSESSSSGSSGSGRGSGRGSSSSGRSGSTSSNNGSRNRNINNTNNTSNSNTGRRKINGCFPFLHIFKSKRT